MYWRNLRKISNTLLLLPIFLFGLLTILATGPGPGPDNPDKPGTLSFVSDSYFVTEGYDAAVTITVIRSGGKDGSVSVDYSTTDGTAKAGSDYSSSHGTLQWADGDNAEKTFDVAISNDSFFENDEAFSVNLSNVKRAALGGTAVTTVNIADDDQTVDHGTLQFENISYSVTEGIDASVSLNVSRTQGSLGAVSVEITTVAGSAVSPTDYTAQNQILNWADGDSASKSLLIPIIDDATPENLESFTVQLSNPLGGAQLGTNSIATVTITDNEQITGSVYAPAGVLAANEPGILKQLFAALFGAKLHAAIGDLVLPVAGVTVNLYQIDANGVVGTAIDSSTSDINGKYALAAPANSPAVNYIVRAEGTVSMDSRVTGMQVDISPATDATSALVTTIATNLDDLSVAEVQEMQTEVEDIIPFIVTTDSPSASQLSDRLQKQALRMEDKFRVLHSKVSAGSICGLITTPVGSYLAGVDVVVRSYSDWLQVAKTVTNNAGSYCVNVPRQGDSDPDGGNFDGEYIVGVFNRLDSSQDVYRSASGWRASSQPGLRLDADKISVTSSSPVVNYVNMQLVNGAAVSGSVKNATGANIEGVQIIFSDYDIGLPVASARSKSDGSYRISLLPGKYRIQALNETLEPYASLYYDGAGGTNNQNLSTPKTFAVGSENTLDFVLEAGAQLTGTITDGGSSNPVIRSRVRIDLMGDANFGSTFSDRLGYYHVWLKPQSYDIYAYGQNTKAVNLGSAGATVPVDFSASVSTIKGTLRDGSGNPVKYAKLRLYDSAFDYMAFTIGDSNGQFTAYSVLTGNHYLEFRIDRAGTSYGSSIYNSKTQLEGGDPIAIASVGNAVNLTVSPLPAPGLLIGTVYSDGTKTATIANFRVQIRDGGVNPVNRFLTVRTRGDGSYLIALPAATYARVKMPDATLSGNCDSVPVVAGGTTVLNFINSSDVCEVNP